MSISLNDREIAVLNSILESKRTKGYPPSVREICKTVGLKSSSTVHTYLSSLEKKGYIRRDPSKPRAIEILIDISNENELSTNTVFNDLNVRYDNRDIEVNSSLSLINEEIVSVPIVGKVAAGYPISAVENIEEYFPLPKSFTGDTEVYMLKVSGESMINAGIFDGDIVVVRKQDIAKNGEIVVALIDDEATVKRFYLEKDHVRLEPENPLFEPIITTHGSVIGKVIGLIRTIH